MATVTSWRPDPNRCDQLGGFVIVWNRAFLAIRCILLLGLLVVAIRWLVTQRKASNAFKITRWHNFGIALACIIIANILNIVYTCLTYCWVLKRPSETYGFTITADILPWIAYDILLVIVLIPICRGLQHLHGTPRAPSLIFGTILSSILIILTIIYNALYIWENATLATQFKNAFEELHYVRATLWLLWLLVAIAADASMLVYVNRARHNAPGPLKTWIRVLALALFAMGFLRMFQSFYYDVGRNDERHQGTNIAWRVLNMFFTLLAFAATGEVGFKLSTAWSLMNAGVWARYPGDSVSEGRQPQSQFYFN